jgi:hypothetical protein
MIFAMFGLHDVYRVLGDTRAKALFDAGIATLGRREVLDRYDLGFCSSYDQLPFRLAIPRYNYIHVMQLYVLYRITGLTVFRDYAERWQVYSEAWRYRLRVAASLLGQRLVLLIIRQR